MAHITGEERSLARASLYRLLSLLFGYPVPGTYEAVGRALAAAEVAADLIDPVVAAAVCDLGGVVAGTSEENLEPSYQHSFTLSYNEDCPLYETAFSAKHIFQQTQQQADIAGFYRAFGVDPKGDRPDHLALELEFLYLLTLKQAVAQGQADTEHVKLCRSAQRGFVRDHLARWAPHVAGRIAVAARGTVYEAAARLLHVFVESEERYLRLGHVPRFSDEPLLIADEPSEFSCPAADTPAAVSLELVHARKGGAGDG